MYCNLIMILLSSKGTCLIFERDVGEEEAAAALGRFTIRVRASSIELK